jgi:16S rRNA (guanine966-N2)-methyltransferase
MKKYRPISLKPIRPKQFEFTVIAGSLKGRTITAPDLGVTRPPLSRLRKAIFDFLVPYLDGTQYLDLFSGTGSYLFEAVSRGAAHGTGVELEPVLARAIADQARKFGVEGELTCLCKDVFAAIPELARQGKRFEIIMMAPPQYVGLIDRTLAALKASPLSTPDGIILCQHDTSETDKINYGGWKILQQRKYGNTMFTVLAGQ